MTRDERLTFIKQSFTALEGLTSEINEKITHAKEGVSEGNVNLIIGSLAGVDQAAHHLKNIHEAMIFIHRGK
jgi:hypothetical protein